MLFFQKKIRPIDRHSIAVLIFLSIIFFVFWGTIVSYAFLHEEPKNNRILGAGTFSYEGNQIDVYSGNSSFTLRDAINSAGDGDTIVVHGDGNSKYTETFVTGQPMEINKSIKITSDGGAVILSINGTYGTAEGIFKVNKSDVTIEGFASIGIGSANSNTIIGGLINVTENSDRFVLKDIGSLTTPNANTACTTLLFIDKAQDVQIQNCVFSSLSSVAGAKTISANGAGHLLISGSTLNVAGQNSFSVSIADADKLTMSDSKLTIAGANSKGMDLLNVGALEIDGCTLTGNNAVNNTMIYVRGTSMNTLTMKNNTTLYMQGISNRGFDLENVAEIEIEKSSLTSNKADVIMLQAVNSSDSLIISETKISVIGGTLAQPNIALKLENVKNIDLKDSNTTDYFFTIAAYTTFVSAANDSSTGTSLFMTNSNLNITGTLSTGFNLDRMGYLSMSNSSIAITSTLDQGLNLSNVVKIDIEACSLTSNKAGTTMISAVNTANSLTISETKIHLTGASLAQPSIALALENIKNITFKDSNTTDYFFTISAYTTFVSAVDSDKVSMSNSYLTVTGADSVGMDLNNVTTSLTITSSKISVSGASVLLPNLGLKLKNVKNVTLEDSNTDDYFFTIAAYATFVSAENDSSTDTSFSMSNSKLVITNSNCTGFKLDNVGSLSITNNSSIKVDGTSNSVGIKGLDLTDVDKVEIDGSTISSGRAGFSVMSLIGYTESLILKNATISLSGTSGSTNTSSGITLVDVVATTIENCTFSCTTRTPMFNADGGSLVGDTFTVRNTTLTLSGGSSPGFVLAGVDEVTFENNCELKSLASSNDVITVSDAVFFNMNNTLVEFTGASSSDNGINNGVILTDVKTITFEDCELTSTSFASQNTIITITNSPSATFKKTTVFTRAARNTMLHLTNVDKLKIDESTFTSDGADGTEPNKDYSINLIAGTDVDDIEICNNAVLTLSSYGGQIYSVARGVEDKGTSFSMTDSTVNQSARPVGSHIEAFTSVTFTGNTINYLTNKGGQSGVDVEIFRITDCPSFIAKDNTITLAAASMVGFLVEGAPLNYINGNTITTTANNNIGFKIQAGDAASLEIKFNNNTIAASGTSSYGLCVPGTDVDVDITSSDCNITLGSNSSGIYAEDFNSFFAADIAITTSLTSSKSYGIQLVRGTDATIKDSNFISPANGNTNRNSVGVITQGTDRVNILHCNADLRNGNKIFEFTSDSNGTPTKNLLIDGENENGGENAHIYVYSTVDNTTGLSLIALEGATIKNMIFDNNYDGVALAAKVHKNYNCVGLGISSAAVNSTEPSVTNVLITECTFDVSGIRGRGIEGGGTGIKNGDDIDDIYYSLQYVTVSHCTFNVKGQTGKSDNSDQTYESDPDNRKAIGMAIYRQSYGIVEYNIANVDGIYAKGLAIGPGLNCEMRYNKAYGFNKGWIGLIADGIGNATPSIPELVDDYHKIFENELYGSFSTGVYIGSNQSSFFDNTFARESTYDICQVEATISTGINILHNEFAPAKNLTSPVILVDGAALGNCNNNNFYLALGASNADHVLVMRGSTMSYPTQACVVEESNTISGMTTFDTEKKATITTFLGTSTVLSISNAYTYVITLPRQFELNVVKEDENGEPIDGVGFTLYIDSIANANIVGSGFTNPDGKLTILADEGYGSPNNLEDVETGSKTAYYPFFPGKTTCKMILVETAPADGYEMNEGKSYTFILNKVGLIGDNGNDAELYVSTQEGTDRLLTVMTASTTYLDRVTGVEEAETSTPIAKDSGTITVKNVLSIPEYNLPKTGGRGFLYFTLIGCVFVLLGIVLFLDSFRNRKKKIT